MRLKNLILIVAALATVVALAGCGSAGQSGSDQQGDQQKEQKAQKQETPDKQVAPEKGTKDTGDEQAAVDPPPNDMMKLTVPKMEMIKDDEIPTGLGTDETLFHDYAGVHIKHTGFPWEKEANVYIAGHRLGFPSDPLPAAGIGRCRRKLDRHPAPQLTVPGFPHFAGPPRPRTETRTNSASVRPASWAARFASSGISGAASAIGAYSSARTSSSRI